MKITRPLVYKFSHFVAWGICLLTLSIVLSYRVGTPKSPFFDADMMTAIMSVPTVLLLYYTFIQARYAAEDADRPHISVSIRLRHSTHRVLVIENTGRAVAVDVQLRLQNVKQGLEVLSQIGDRLIDNPLFSDKADIPTHWSYEFLLMDGTEYAKDPNEDTYPQRFSINVKFRSLNGTSYEYSVPIQILNHRNSLVPKPPASVEIELLRKELKSHVSKITTELRSISRALARISK